MAREHGAEGEQSRRQQRGAADARQDQPRQTPRQDQCAEPGEDAQHARDNFGRGADLQRGGRDHYPRKVGVPLQALAGVEDDAGALDQVAGVAEGDEGVVLEPAAVEGGVGAEQQGERAERQQFAPPGGGGPGTVPVHGFGCHGGGSSPARCVPPGRGAAGAA